MRARRAAATRDRVGLAREAKRAVEKPRHPRYDYIEGCYRCR